MMSSLFVIYAALAVAVQGFALTANNNQNHIPLNNVESVSTDGRRIFVEIIEGPKPTRHNLGEATELKCIAIGHPAPRITWQKNNEPYIQNAIDTNENVESSGTSFAAVVSVLQIITAPTQNEDTYTCVAETALKIDQASTTVFNEMVPAVFNSISTLNRELLSAPRAPRIIEHARSFLGNIGTTLVLPCRVSGNPEPKISWRRSEESQPINANERMKILKSGDLVLRQTRWSDMGQYVCTGKNEFGKDSAVTFLYPVLPDNDDFTRQ